MGLENVINEVQGMAEKQRTAILTEAKESAKRITREADEKAERLRKENREKTNAQAEELKNMRLSAYRLELKKQTMQAKKEILDQVFEKALEKTRTLKNEEKKKVFKQLMEQALRELPDAKYVYSNKEDAKLVQELNSKLKRGENINCVSGFVLENADQTVKVNYTFDVLFEKIHEGYLHEVAGKIFEK